MTEHPMTTNTDRRKNIRLLKALGKDLKDRGAAKVHCVGGVKRAIGFKLWDEAHAILWALDYVQQHVDLETGEIRVVHPEPEEAA